jgi:thiamine-phosphate pyrophosphorylase
MRSQPQEQVERPAPRLYLITPPVEDAPAFAEKLSDALAEDIAAVLLRLAPADERTLINRVKVLAKIIQNRDVALVLDGQAGLVARSGADGAHLTGIQEFENALATLKPERIAGAGGLATRHEAMLAAERGADYVLFGEPGIDGSRPAFDAVLERVAWWAEVFEIPCVGYAGNLDEIGALAKAGADFIAAGDFIFRDPLGAQAMLAAARQGLIAEPVP